MSQAAVEWLIRDDDVERAVPVSDRMAIDDDCWRATIERFEPAEGIWVFLSTADVYRDVTFDTHQATPEVRLLSQIPARGAARLAFDDGVSVDLCPSRSVLFLPAARRGVFTLSPQRALSHAGLSIAAERVRQIFGEELPDEIAQLIGDHGRTRLIETPTGAAMRRLAASLFAETLRGPLRMIFMEGVALQILAMQAAAARSERRTAPGRRQPPRWLFEAARERLLADMTAPPSLVALAASAGITDKMLNAGFRRYFGGTVYSVLRDERLEHARIALETTDAPIKQIAHRVGYSHVSNFTTAFAARYGAPPARYVGRRGGRTGSDETG